MIQLRLTTFYDLQLQIVQQTSCHVYYQCCAKCIFPKLFEKKFLHIFLFMTEKCAKKNYDFLLKFSEFLAHKLLIKDVLLCMCAQIIIVTCTIITIGHITLSVKTLNKFRN